VSDTVEKTKAKRTHVNFSKVTVEVEGRPFSFSLTKKGLVVRRWHSPRPKVISFSALVDLTIDQRQLL
jgi:hypothetical protein